MSLFNPVLRYNCRHIYIGRCLLYRYFISTLGILMSCILQGMLKGHSDVFQIRFRRKEIDHNAHYTQVGMQIANKLPARVAGQMESSPGRRYLFDSGVRIKSVAHRRLAGTVPDAFVGFQYQRHRNLDRPIQQ